MRNLTDILSLTTLSLEDNNSEDTPLEVGIDMVNF